ncbi:hypothetical protein BT63DRAFT_461210 [Microthyrium microscopicum]|uniref:Mid2 domain-containing protein n=1 Tax=Microthyrium microscopicum TaxID=703497 RepID=A0A6A6TXU0_9PEZI|nr:hypothetical protein BT63DRAFT_461210 [Microthyrium microscopicum]
MRSLLLAAASLVAELAFAVPNAAPAPTGATNIDLGVWGASPRPTDGPNFELMRKRGVERALSSGQLVGYFAPDATCGYNSGKLGAPITCQPGHTCAAVAAIGNVPGAIGCCSSGCNFVTLCYNLADVQASKCDHACQQDADVLQCTASAAPYCYGYTWPDITATNWICGTATGSTKDVISFTYLGESDNRSWSAYYYSGSSASSTGLLSSAVSAAPVAASSSSSSSSSTPTPPPAPVAKSNAGAIAGGVVGGVAVLAALAFGVFFLLHRNKKNKNAAPIQADHAAPNSGYPQQQGYPQGQSPGQHMAAAPVAGAAAGFYGQEHKPGMSEMASPTQSPNAGYGYPAKVGDNAYSPQTDNRVSTFSETGAPAPAYQPPQHMAAPMELDATSAVPHSNPQGQPIYEVPGHVPGHPQ